MSPEILTYYCPICWGKLQIVVKHYTEEIMLLWEYLPRMLMPVSIERVIGNCRTENIIANHCPHCQADIVEGVIRKKSYCQAQFM